MTTPFIKISHKNLQITHSTGEFFVKKLHIAKNSNKILLHFCNLANVTKKFNIQQKFRNLK